MKLWNHSCVNNFTVFVDDITNLGSNAPSCSCLPIICYIYENMNISQGYNGLKRTKIVL